MKSMQKLGGIGGFAAAATFVVGVAMFATMFFDYATTTDPTEALAFLADNHVPLYIWNNIVYIVFGIVLVPFTLAWLIDSGTIRSRGWRRCSDSSGRGWSSPQA
jgi:hypothetical protein